MPDSLLECAESGDKWRMLRALRDRLALEIDSTSSARDVASLSNRLIEVVKVLESAPGPEAVTPLAQLIARRKDL